MAEPSAGHGRCVQIQCWSFLATARLALSARIEDGDGSGTIARKAADHDPLHRTLFLRSDCAMPACAAD